MDMKEYETIRTKIWDRAKGKFMADNIRLLLDMTRDWKLALEVFNLWWEEYNTGQPEALMDPNTKYQASDELYEFTCRWLEEAYRVGYVGFEYKRLG